MKHIHVPPLGWLARIADKAMVPLMYCLAGVLREAPQMTHRWNNMKLKPGDVAHLNRSMMVFCRGRNDATERFIKGLPYFHITIYGGWKHYVVIEPCSGSKLTWHVGWIAGNVIGVTRINLHGRVRLLIGPGDVHFFGIHSDSGAQVTVRKVGSGSIGDGGEFAQLPLL